MPYIAVSAGLIHTMQFHLPRTVATVLKQGLGYGFNLKIRVLWTSWILYAHLRRRCCILLCAWLLVGLYTLIADSQLLVKRIIKIAWLLRLQLGLVSSLYWGSLLFCRPGRGGGNVKIITDFVAAGGGGVNVYLHKDFNCYNGIFLDLFVGLSSYFHCCIVKCCFTWFVIMCVYYTVPFVTSLVWRFKVVWLRITDEHTVVVNSPATCGSHREETLSHASSHHPHRIHTKNFHNP